MSRAVPAPRTGVGAIAGCLVLAILPGCVGMGGNIKGSFACRAPDGICAPSAVIDDRALAMIIDDPSAATAADIFPRTRGTGETAPTGRTRAAHGLDAAGARRTGDRVMRIVFPAHVDEMGRLHEASAIHAVVAPGEWRATASGPSPVRNALAAAPQMIERVETAGTHGDVPTATDPDLPDPGAVAAARMRAADPLARIKADVQQRLRVSSSPARSRPSALRKDGAPALQASAGEASIPGQEKAASPNLVEQRSAIGQASLEEPKAASPAPADAGLFPAFAREGE